MSLIIRQFINSDKVLVMQLHIDGLIQYGASIGDPALDIDMDQIEDSYINKNGEFLVGLKDGDLICMGAYKRVDDGTAEIKRVRIKREFQGRGLGGQILTALEESAKRRGYKEVILDTTSKQIPAQKLFLKSGYVEIDRRKYGEMELIYYIKNLTGGIQDNQ